MYAVSTILLEVPDDKFTILSIVIHVLWWVVECGSTDFQITDRLGLKTLHDMVGMNGGVIVNMCGCEGLYDQVGNTIMQLVVPICDNSNLLAIKCMGDWKYHPTTVASVREVRRFNPVVEGQNFPPLLFPQFHNNDGGRLGRYPGSGFSPLL